MKNYTPPMEATMFAMRNQEGGRDMVRNLLIGQAVNQIGNMALDMFEPSQRKQEEEKDFGDKTRDLTRNLLNLGTSGYTAYQLGKGYGVFGGGQAPDAPPTGAQQAQPYGYLPSTEGTTHGAAQGAPSPAPEPTMTERMRRGEELTRQARSERMPGVRMGNLNEMVDEDMMNRLKGLEAEAAAYPKPSTEPSDYEKGIAAGMEAMAMRQVDEGRPLAQAPAVPAAATPQTPAFRSPEASANPLLRQEPKDFNETFGQRRDTGSSSQEREAERNELLGKFYGNLPTDPNTGERDLSFATSFLARKGSIAPETVAVIDPEVDMPRRSGDLLAGQLQGETAFDQQQNRRGFVQDQQMDAINTADEQGPGFKSQPSADQILQSTLSSTMSQLANREAPSFAPSPEMVPNYVREEFREKPAPSKTVSSVEPVVKTTTIIEETAPAPQAKMSPMEASEKLRRIQTSGRPTARQEAQDFLAQIKGSMING